MLRTIIIIMVVLLTLMTVFGFMSGRVSSISLAVAVAWNAFLLPFALFVNRMSDLACRIGLHIALVGGLARWTFGWLLSPTSDIFPATITGLLLPPILLFAISFETPREVPGPATFALALWAQHSLWEVKGSIVRSGLATGD